MLQVSIFFCDCNQIFKIKTSNIPFFKWIDEERLCWRNASKHLQPEIPLIRVGPDQERIRSHKRSIGESAIQAIHAGDAVFGCIVSVDEEQEESAYECQVFFKCINICGHLKVVNGSMHCWAAIKILEQLLLHFL